MCLFTVYHSVRMLVAPVLAVDQQFRLVGTYASIAAAMLSHCVQQTNGRGVANMELFKWCYFTKQCQLGGLMDNVLRLFTAAVDHVL